MLKLGQKLITKIKVNPNFFYLISFALIYLVWNYGKFVQLDDFPSLSSQQLDPSWILGLNWASSLKLRWLADSVVFTYGPLYYLNGLLMPQFHSENLINLTSIGLNLFYTGCFTYIYSLFVNSGNKNKWITIIVVLMLFFQKPNIDLVPLFAAFIFLPIIFADKNKKPGENFQQYIRYGIISLLLAVIPFIKFTHVYESYLFIIIMASFLIYRRKYLDAALISILFAGFTVLTWVVTTGESIFSLFPYLASRFSMSSGYTEVMFLNLPQIILYRFLILALLFLTILLIIFTYLFFTKRWSWAIAWLLPLIPLFLGFKSGFVRADHAMIFLNYIFISALYYFYLLEIMILEKQEESNDLHWRQSIAHFLTPILTLFVLATFYYQGGAISIKSELLNTSGNFDWIKQPSPSKDKKTLRKTYNLDDKFLSQIDQEKKIDIIPWDIALLYGYNLSWKPRPVIQSYASYTSTLDHLDANFFKQADSPSQLIFSLFGIDTRYSIFDTPQTFRALLDNYQFVTTAECNCYSLFNKKEKPLSRKLFLMNQREYKFNQNILIPNAPNAHIFMMVEIEPTLMGKFLNIVYKPTISYIDIKLDTGVKIRHRFIRDTAKNGLFVSRYIKDMADLSAVFNETYSQNIISLRFVGDTSLYSDNIKVQFNKVFFEEK